MFYTPIIIDVSNLHCANDESADYKLFSLLTQTAKPGDAFYSCISYDCLTNDAEFVKSLPSDGYETLNENLFRITVKPSHSFIVRDARNETGISFQILEEAIGASRQGTVFASTQTTKPPKTSKVIKQLHPIPQQDTFKSLRNVLFEYLANLRYQLLSPHPSLPHLNWRINVTERQIIPTLTIARGRGETLFQKIHTDAEFSAGDRIITAIRLCSELLSFHKKTGMVFRNIHPDNALLDSQGDVRFVNFGLAVKKGSACALRGRPHFLDRALLLEFAQGHHSPTHEQKHDCHALMMTLFCLLAPFDLAKFYSECDVINDLQLANAYKQTLFAEIMPKFLEHDVFNDLSTEHKSTFISAIEAFYYSNKSPKERIRLLLKNLMILIGTFAFNDDVLSIWLQGLDLVLSDGELNHTCLPEWLKTLDRQDESNRVNIISLMCKLLDSASLIQLKNCFEQNSPSFSESKEMLLHNIRIQEARQAPRLSPPKADAFRSAIAKAEAMLCDPALAVVTELKKQWLQQLQKKLEASYWDALQQDEDVAQTFKTHREKMSAYSLETMSPTQILSVFEEQNRLIKSFTHVTEFVRQANPMKQLCYQFAMPLRQEAEIIQEFEAQLKPTPKITNRVKMCI